MLQGVGGESERQSPVPLVAQIRLRKSAVDDQHALAISSSFLPAHRHLDDHALATSSSSLPAHRNLDDALLGKLGLLWAALSHHSRWV